MNDDLVQLVDEAIRLEQNVAELYLSFYEAFPEDSDFWWQLALEEKNHAALLRSARQHFMQEGLFPTEIVSITVETLDQANKELKQLLAKQKVSPMSRESAFRSAIKLEESAGEAHFQRAMEKQPDSPAIKIFQKLNEDDKDHERRIRDYMKKRQIAQR